VFGALSKSVWTGVKILGANGCLPDHIGWISVDPTAGTFERSNESPANPGAAKLLRKLSSICAR
jgi:hypothetical protein